MVLPLVVTSSWPSTDTPRPLTDLVLLGVAGRAWVVVSGVTFWVPSPPARRKRLKLEAQGRIFCRSSPDCDVLCVCVCVCVCVCREGTV
ncbi:hypothetical protein LX36DRAFT_372336 [Colletotrichum falcatum]|nr:hypothetical protein LX36DRAFT_372336 [Colletotrichum falcatum]